MGRRKDMASLDLATVRDHGVDMACHPRLVVMDNQVGITGIHLVSRVTVQAEVDRITHVDRIKVDLERDSRIHNRLNGAIDNLDISCQKFVYDYSGVYSCDDTRRSCCQIIEFSSK